MPLLEQVLEQYPKQVKVVFKNFPLRNHNQALPAAIASLAAYKQGKFWPMHDAIFLNYNKLSSQKLDELANQVGLDKARYNQDMTDPLLRNQVAQDTQQGLQAGVRGTPTVFINGKLLRQRSLGTFKEMIDKELQKQKK